MEVHKNTCNFESFKVAWLCYRPSFIFSNTGSPCGSPPLLANFLLLNHVSWHLVFATHRDGCLNPTCMPVECILWDLLSEHNGHGKGFGTAPCVTLWLCDLWSQGVPKGPATAGRVSLRTEVPALTSSSHEVILVILETWFFYVVLRLALNSQRSACLSLPSARITHPISCMQPFMHPQTEPELNFNSFLECWWQSSE